MRTQPFRTSPVLVDSADKVVALKDMDGADPFTLTIENVDTIASLRTRYGSKNANLLFVAKETGTTGNNNRVIIGSVASKPKNQAFLAERTSHAHTITLQTDASGIPNLTADEIARRLNANADTALLLRIVRAPGSDGSAIFGLVYDTDPTDLAFDKFLTGGFDATDVTVKVATSPTGFPDFAGPWDDVALVSSAIPAGQVGTVQFADAPVRGLRVEASPAPYPSKVVVTAVVRKRGGV